MRADEGYQFVTMGQQCEVELNRAMRKLRAMLLCASGEADFVHSFMARFGEGSQSKNCVGASVKHALKTYCEIHGDCSA